MLRVIAKPYHQGIKGWDPVIIYSDPEKLQRDFSFRNGQSDDLARPNKEDAKVGPLGKNCACLR